jgi:hypothetical protein
MADLQSTTGTIIMVPNGWTTAVENHETENQP